MRQQLEDSFVDFATAVKPWLLTTAWMLTSDPHTSEDLVQETLARVYVKWRKVSEQQPAAYARRVLANLHTDRWRRTRREVLVGEVSDQVGAKSGPDPVTVDLVRALQSLGPRERQCVVMRHYLDLSERQTADTLGVSVGSVKGYTARGLVALRAVLMEENNV